LGLEPLRTQLLASFRATRLFRLSLACIVAGVSVEGQRPARATAHTN